MLEAFAANELQQFLQLRNLCYARAAKCIERIVGKFTRTRIASYHAAPIVGGVARVTHRARLYAAHAGAKRVELADGPGNDFLVVHLHVFEEMLGQIRAVEADTLVRMSTVVVVPVEQRRRRAAG